jgi:diguanylate cyclase (GGDEF)-like protein/PAS domain S-box-containing protein
MDTDAEDAFDRLTRIASRLIGAPVAISLVDDHRQYFKSRVDIDTRQTPLSHSLCQHVVLDGAPLIVTDARQDARLRENLAVAEGGVIAYAGVPLISSDGQRLGSFCATDSTPREWTDAEVALLTELARSAMTEIELRMANRELAARDAETRSIIESSHEAFFSCDREGTILAFNPAAERLFGWTEAEVLGRPVMQTLVPEDLREQAAADFQRGDRALDGLRNELRATHRSGRELLIEASFAIADLPEGRRFHVFVRGIGELRALERHRDHLASIVKTSQDAISTIDCDGLITTWNDGAERLYGFTAAEMIGSRPLPSEQPSEDETDRLAARALAGHSESVHGLGRRHRCGKLVYVDMSVSPLRDERGRVVGATAIARDVTEQRNLELQLEVSERRFRTTFEDGPIGIVLLAPDRRLLRLNRAFSSMLGYDAEELIGRNLDRITHPEDLSHDLVEIDRTLAGEQTAFELTKRYFHRTGRIVHARISVSLVRGEDGAPGHFVAQVEDVTGQREGERRRRALEERHRELLSSLPDAMVVLYDTDLRCTLLQGALLSELGITPEQFEGRALSETISPERFAQLEPYLRRALDGESTSFHYPGTGDRVFGVAVAPYHGEDDAITGAFTVWRNITPRVREQQARLEVEEQLRVTVEHAPIGVALIDLRAGAHGRLVSVNKAFAALFAHPDPVAGGLSLASVVHPNDAEALRSDLTLLSTDSLARTENEVRFRRPDGGILWLLLNGAAVPSPNGTPQLAVVHALDIGEHKRFEHQLQHLADHDALTGLFNRRRFQAELVRAVSLADRYDHPTALLMIDLDGFKHVNDTMGHSSGDELVTSIGSTLRRTLRDTDVIARLGGDEFALIVSIADLHEATVVADKVLRAIERHGVVIGEERQAGVTASVGVTVFDKSTGLDAEELMMEADVAMYQAKDAGRNQQAVFQRDLGPGAELTARQSWLVRLRTALEEDQFELYAQPIRGIHADGIERFELLLRLRGDDGELLTPATFLYNAERFDLIQQIDRWVFAQAAQMLGACAAAGRDVSLSVNMSAKTLCDREIIADLTSIVASHPIPRDRLVVEVTETVAIVHIDRARAVARSLHELGCGFALDDFGAGFASFYHLKHLKFDFVKIDGEFVKSVGDNTTDRLVVKSVVDLARGLGAETIAEYVEDAGSMQRLTDLGVDFAQGFHLGRPVPVAQVLPETRRSPAR